MNNQKKLFVYLLKNLKNLRLKQCRLTWNFFLRIPNFLSYKEHPAWGREMNTWVKHICFTSDIACRGLLYVVMGGVASIRNSTCDWCRGCESIPGTATVLFWLMPGWIHRTCIATLRVGHVFRASTVLTHSQSAHYMSGGKLVRCLSRGQPRLFLTLLRKAWVSRLARLLCLHEHASSLISGWSYQ